MPPWLANMSPQQQLLFLQLMRNSNPVGTQFGGTPPLNPNTGQPMMGQAGQMGINPALMGANNPLANPMMGQAQQNQMNSLLPYLLGQGGGMQQPNIAQLLQMRGAGLGL